MKIPSSCINFSATVVLSVENFGKCAIPHSWAQSASSQRENVKPRKEEEDGPGSNTFVP